MVDDIENNTLRLKFKLQKRQSNLSISLTGYANDLNVTQLEAARDGQMACHMRN